MVQTRATSTDLLREGTSNTPSAGANLIAAATSEQSGEPLTLALAIMMGVLLFGGLSTVALIAEDEANKKP